MTGFARAEGRVGQRAWTWEIKSVNGRGLDMRFRLPSGFEAIEPPARHMASERLRRGSLAITLELPPAATTGVYRLNKDLLRELVELAREAQTWIAAAPASVDALFAVPGVVELVTPTEDEAGRAAREAALLQSFALALDNLVIARTSEGNRIATVLRDQLDDIDRLVEAAAACAAARPEALRARLQEQVDTLLAAAPSVSGDRLAQELALLLVKLDVREELDRLVGHVANGRGLVEQGDRGGVGRALDFLAQEFSREANTLCAKSGDAALTRVGLDLKLAIDRFREQVHNIE